MFEVIINFVFYILIAFYVVFDIYKEYSELSFRSLFIIVFSLEHFIITFIFAFFLDKFPSINDPQRFYNVALESETWFSLFNLGNSSISFFIYPFVQLELKIETLFFLFSTIGWKGFMLLFKNVNVKINYRNVLILLFFLIPSIHLWTSSLSKEPLLLFFMSLIIVSFKDDFIVNKNVIICLLYTSPSPRD